MEHKLHEWIVDQNINHGVAPSRDQVVAELPQCIHECAPPEIRERLSGIEGAGADVCGREAALTRIICGVQAKVGPGIRSAAVANLGQLVPNLGPRGGPKFGTAGTKNIKAGPKLSPSDGARFGPSI